MKQRRPWKPCRALTWLDDRSALITVSLVKTMVTHLHEVAEVEDVEASVTVAEVAVDEGALVTVAEVVVGEGALETEVDAVAQPIVEDLVISLAGRRPFKSSLDYRIMHPLPPRPPSTVELQMIPMV